MTDYQPARPALTAAQVAIELGHDVEWFYANRAALEAEHGFPKPLAGCGNRWDIRAIDAWKDAQLPASARMTTDPAVLDFGAGLKARAKKLAGKA